MVIWTNAIAQQLQGDINRLEGKIPTELTKITKV